MRRLHPNCTVACCAPGLQPEASIAALLVGRPRDYTESQKSALDDTLPIAIGSEANRPDMPVLTNCDFGHTDPQWALPLGCTVEVDPQLNRIVLVERAVADVYGAEQDPARAQPFVNVRPG